MKFIDLFCGIGRFKIALEKLGHKCVFSCEIDEETQKVYTANFGGKAEGDVRDVDEKKIPEFDILCAGFPCQPFSRAGKKEGLDDERGQLFNEILRIVNHQKPSILLLENVPFLAKLNRGKTLKMMKKDIEDLGYTFFSKVLCASHFGLPQARKRLYIVALKRGSLSDILPQLKQWSSQSATASLLCLQERIEPWGSLGNITHDTL